MYVYTDSTKTTNVYEGWYSNRNIDVGDTYTLNYWSQGPYTYPTDNNWIVTFEVDYELDGSGNSMTEDVSIPTTAYHLTGTANFVNQTSSGDLSKVDLTFNLALQFDDRHSYDDAKFSNVTVRWYSSDHVEIGSRTIWSRSGSGDYPFQTKSSSDTSIEYLFELNGVNFESYMENLATTPTYYRLDFALEGGGYDKKYNQTYQFVYGQPFHFTTADYIRMPEP